MTAGEREGDEGRGSFRTTGTRRRRGKESKTQTRRQREAEGSACLGCVCAGPALGGARALAAPPLGPPAFQESWGREETDGSELREGNDPLPWPELYLEQL